MKLCTEGLKLLNDCEAQDRNLKKAISETNRIRARRAYLALAEELYNHCQDCETCKEEMVA